MPVPNRGEVGASSLGVHGRESPASRSFLSRGSGSGWQRQWCAWSVPALPRELLRSFRHWSGRAQHRSGLPPIRGLTKRCHRRAAFRRNSLTRIAPHRADQSTLLFSRAGVPDKSFPHKPCLSQLVRRCGLLPIAQPARHSLIGYADSPHVPLLNRPDSSPR